MLNSKNFIYYYKDETDVQREIEELEDERNRELVLKHSFQYNKVDSDNTVIQYISHTNVSYISILFLFLVLLLLFRESRTY